MATSSSIAGNVAPRIRAPARGGFNPAAHGLRGIASMMVFWAHLLGGTAEHIYADHDSYVDLVRGPWNFGVWGVELFFVISGFVILPSVMRYSLREFALRRFFRLYPLFLFFSLVFIAMNAATNAYPAMNTPLAVLGGLTFLNLFTHTEQLTPNAWSLTYEVMFYALAAIGYSLAVRQRSRWGAALVAILSCAFLLRYPIAFFFLAGALVRIAYDAGIRPAPGVARPLEVLLGLVCVYLASLHHLGYSRADMAEPVAWALMATTPAYFYLAIQPDSVSTRLFRSRAIAYLGTVSYSLYLLHPYTYYGFRLLFDRMGWFTQDWLWSMALFFAVTTPVTLALTHVVHKALEIAPYRRFFHQRIYRGAAGGA
ncbi:acyltransferase family protein [Stakelama saccharophila]|uniref:Acyltransferase n=1 Tax=Stakelama saccharophila TaxID=3075605 RepID=A0ABZ0BD25_9SPHN|nr:acyltransferase [Stakelama sp. W311]WNO54189.1 acyltransferase [Stakelama sp. W311]